MINLSRIFIVWVTVMAIATAVYAQEKGGEDLAAKAQNPVGAMYSLPFKFNAVGSRGSSSAAWSKSRCAYVGSCIAC